MLLHFSRIPAARSALVTCFLLSTASSAVAKTSVDAPSGSTGVCKDGSYSTSVDKKGACRGHKGVKDWYLEAATVAPTNKVDSTSAVPPTSSQSRALPSKAAPTSETMTQNAPGAARVWANDESKIYHCNGDRYYGKTKTGEYLTEAQAKAKGFQPDHGKPCK